MKELKHRPLSGPDREKIVQKLRQDAGYATHRVHKARYGPNDIFGCIDVVSYCPQEFIMDQVSTVHHIPDKIHEIERMLFHAPASDNIKIFVFGIDGYKQGSHIIVTRLVRVRWNSSNHWEKVELITRGNKIDYTNYKRIENKNNAAEVKI